MDRGVSEAKTEEPTELDVQVSFFICTVLSIYHFFFLSLTHTLSLEKSLYVELFMSPIVRLLFGPMFRNNSLKIAVNMKLQDFFRGIL